MKNASELEKTDYVDYIEQIFDRSKKLIQYEVWHGIKEQRLDAWIGCFKNHDSELLGAYLLDNLCYRSREQFSSHLDVLFVNAELMLGSESKRLLEVIRIKAPGDPLEVHTCLVPVIDEQSPPTKSGPYILRLAQRRHAIHSDWLAWPRQIKNLTALKHLYFVDDFCGTGTQFIDFAKNIGLDEIYSQNCELKITYLVATAHEKGLYEIANRYPYIKIKFAERLNSLSAVLSNACFSRYEVDGFKSCILEQYDELITATGLPSRGKLAKGFGELGLAYAFAHATPNNTLPIFWYETANWTPLLDR